MSPSLSAQRERIDSTRGGRSATQGDDDRRPKSGDISWERRYRNAVVGVDIAVILFCGAVSSVLWGNGLTGPWRIAGDATGIAATVAVLTLGSAAACRCWERQIVGQGSEEFNRVIKAFVIVAIALSIAALALKDSSIRPWVFGVLPVSAALVLGARWGMRRVLHRARARSRCMRPVLVAGSEDSVRKLIVRSMRARYHGWEVVAACTPSGRPGDEIAGVPVVGDLDAVPAGATTCGARIVAIGPAPEMDSTRLHHLSWELEGTTAELVVDPGLMEIGGPRLHMEPIDGLPLLRLTEPRFTGVSRLTKNAMDRLLATVLLVVLAPLFVPVAILVRRDGGPVFFRQTRVGLAGRPFSIIKFRSMVVDADGARDRLAGDDEGAGPLFKVKSDPRVTRIGATLRRYSLDELPQLVNVLTGSMSLVGPRPPLPHEVEAFSPEARRRLLVRPGLTGLWQVNGRSDLSWEAAVRLDLRYVENWTLALDLQILWKTVGAVIKGRGAY
ncbi:sugar transferase [Actinomycetospora aeridis]|uniref:Sugar transferase n=1 Tax=Actinomycetospora aeridis TaxID=3129231 RepID=A0ABU8N6D9_9PSEU